MPGLLIATIPLVIWIYLLLFRGGFWRVSRNLTPRDLPAPPPKRVAVVIPARDEAAVIEATIASLKAQQFAGAIAIFVVDDGSTDGTAEIAAMGGVVTVIRGQLLPQGWTGKVWAMSQGATAALQAQPDYILFTDADIEHAPDSVSQLVALAETRGCDLVSFMVKLHCETLAERILIPAFVFFFLKLYPPVWIASGQSATAGAAGGCLLIRPTALEKIGGLASIRGEVIDDCALGRAVKQSGGRIWLSLAGETRSTRRYGTVAEVERMIARTAFNQLRHSSLLLAGTVLGLFFTYLLPPLLILTGERQLVLLGLAAWLLMAVAYYPMLRFYGRSPGWRFVLPAVALFYLWATVHSAILYWSGRGGQWKGRAQDH
jgi:hopene-associated glycosyltransferase HpnB